LDRARCPGDNGLLDIPLDDSPVRAGAYKPANVDSLRFRQRAGPR
jgi:hypothetical protein